MTEKEEKENPVVFFSLLKGLLPAPQGIQQQLDQVHRLGVAHDAAVDKNSVAAEEAAHGTEG